jgi:hypothetical protein
VMVGRICPPGRDRVKVKEFFNWRLRDCADATLQAWTVCAADHGQFKNLLSFDNFFFLFMLQFPAKTSVSQQIKMAEGGSGNLRPFYVFSKKIIIEWKEV